MAGAPNKGTEVGATVVEFPSTDVEAVGAVLVAPNICAATVVDPNIGAETEGVDKLPNNPLDADAGTVEGAPEADGVTPPNIVPVDSVPKENAAPVNGTALIWLEFVEPNIPLLVEFPN